MSNGQRFALDEARAAEWLAGEIAQFERWESGASDDPAELEISSGYKPQDEQDGHDTQSIVYFARVNGFITGPGSIEFDYCADDSEVGYVWLVYLDGPGTLKLSTTYTKIRYLGSGEARGGAEEALGVLSQAVFEANALLDDLDRYIAARQQAAVATS